MKEFIYPDFKNNVVNVSATLAEFLGVKNENPTLEILKRELKKDYKNVVFICFDGLGMYPLRTNLKESDLFLRETKFVLTSTFPSTTTNATTSLLTNTLPSTHGWFGWSVYFKQLNKNIDIYLSKDSWTGEIVDSKKIPLSRLEYYFDRANTNYSISTLFPSFVEVSHGERNVVYQTETEFFNSLANICNREGKQFCYAYYPDPDHTMHKEGVKSSVTKSVIESLQSNMQNLLDKTNDTLFVITADHGQIDVTGYVEFYKDEKLMSMLKIYPFLDSRSPAFAVKEGMHEQFESYFKSKYSADFELHKVDELIANGIFGKTEMLPEIRARLGDYIAFGTYTHKQGILTKKSEHFKGHHTSVTEEMEVPLILLNNKKYY